ncbi:MAG: hypothetical protein JNL11_02790 [Bdellovibrionaceae bacterium]|nr:hypothetical protein [Pseudobdellovibrionaceae bacterium]
MTPKSIILNTTSLILTLLAQWTFAHTEVPPGLGSSQAQDLVSQMLQKGGGKGGGGAGTGGGNTKGSLPVAPDQVQKFIMASKKPTVYIFRRFEVIFSSLNVGDDLLNMYNKLYRSEKNVFQALQEAQFHTTPNGPCIDSDGVEKEASAKDFPVICFNLKKISDRVNSDSVQSEILALVTHEVSHGVGTDEREADLLQTMTKGSLANDPYNKIPSLVNIYKSAIEDLQDTLNEILKTLPQLKTPEICVGMTMLMSKISEANNRNMNSIFDTEKNGIALSGLRETEIMMGSMLRTVAGMTYCLSSFPEYQKISRFFGDRKEMPIKEFYSKMYPSQSNIMIGVQDGNIRHLKTGDTATLKLELQDLHTALTEVLNKL